MSKIFVPKNFINKRARFDYILHDMYVAGVVLSGQEVKSVKTGHVSLKGSFVTIKGNEVYLTNALIPPYIHAGDVPNYDPTRPRKLLLKRREISSLIGKSKTEGMTLVPTKIFTERGKIKVEFATATGKKKHDKRQTIEERETKRKIAREMRKKIDR